MVPDHMSVSSSHSTPALSAGGGAQLKHSHSVNDVETKNDHQHHHKHHEKHHHHNKDASSTSTASTNSPATARKGFFGRSNTTPIPATATTVTAPRQKDASCQTDVCAEEYVILDNSEFKSHNNYWTGMYHKLVAPISAVKPSAVVSSEGAGKSKI